MVQNNTYCEAACGRVPHLGVEHRRAVRELDGVHLDGMPNRYQCAPSSGDQTGLSYSMRPTCSTTGHRPERLSVLRLLNCSSFVREYVCVASAHLTAHCEDLPIRQHHGSAVCPGVVHAGQRLHARRRAVGPDCDDVRVVGRVGVLRSKQALVHNICLNDRAVGPVEHWGCMGNGAMRHLPTKEQHTQSIQGSTWARWRET